jgi:hypothetical protein
MSGPLGSSQWMYSSGFYPTEIDQSLMFDGTSYLSRTPSVAGNRKTWTWSGWVKRGALGTNSRTLFSAGTNGSSARGVIDFNDTNTLRFGFNDGSTWYIAETTAVFRDPSAWYHIVVKCDLSNATQSSRAALYVNGVQQTTNSVAWPDADQVFNNTVFHGVGRNYGDGTYYFDGYQADTYLVDGTALDPTSFGEFKNGVWIPKAYTGSYGTNGFHLEYDGNANDSSGTGNNWTATNIASTDYMLDSPTNNFCTLNVISPVTTTALSEGNLLAETISLNVSYYVQSTFEMGSGKWYFETNPLGNVVNGSSRIGLSKNSGTASSDIAIYHGNGQYEIEGVTITGKATYTAGDVIGCAFDPSDNTIEFFKNNVSQGQVSISSSNWQAHARLFSSLASVDNKETVFNFGQDSSFAGNKTPQGNSDANGIGDFYYAPPAGFLALSTANLPEPSISPLYGASPQDHFNTVLWSGNSSTQSITGVGFQPDLVWGKSRNFASNYGLYDSVRGATLELASADTSVEATVLDGLTSFDTDGFSLGDGSRLNNSGRTYVAWNWKASNAASVLNEEGTIPSQVSANTTAGFSIVSYTGTGVNATVGHGLNVAPDMVIVKSTGPVLRDWVVYNSSEGATKYMYLSTTVKSTSSSTRWNDTEPTSDVFSLGTSGATNASENFIAYCFNSVEGYSKFGSYTGNGSDDGPFVYTGFRPAWVLIKRTDDAENWWFLDNKRNPYNQVDTALRPNDPAADGVSPTKYAQDFLSNGIKLKTLDPDVNIINGTYIYMAFAENPFKYANAR